MSEIRVDAIKTRAGAVPTANDVGINVTGTVLQVVHQTISGSLTSTASSSLTVGASMSITPSSTSSKILVFVSMNIGIQKSASGSEARVDLRLVNSDASEIAYDQRFVGTDSQGTGNLSVLDSFHGYFSPSSTSSQTYKVQVNGDATIKQILWYANAIHTMTALEIAGNFMLLISIKKENKMATIAEALLALNIDKWVLSDEPTTETEFL